MIQVDEGSNSSEKPQLFPTAGVSPYGNMPLPDFGSFWATQNVLSNFENSYGPGKRSFAQRDLEGNTGLNSTIREEIMAMIGSWMHNKLNNFKKPLFVMVFRRILYKLTEHETWRDS